MLVNIDNKEVKFYIELSNGSTLGPYDSKELAEQSRRTLPMTESSAPIVPKNSSGQQVLFG